MVGNTEYIFQQDKKAHSYEVGFLPKINSLNIVITSTKLIFMNNLTFIISYLPIQFH